MDEENKQAVVGIADLTLMITCGAEESAFICERGSSENVDMLALLFTNGDFSNGSQVKITLNSSTLTLCPHATEYDDIIWSTVTQDCSLFEIETLDSDKFVPGIHFRLLHKNGEKCSYISKIRNNNNKFDIFLSDGVSNLVSECIIFEVFSVPNNPDNSPDMKDVIEESDIFCQDESVDGQPSCPEGSEFVRNMFQEGPLGIKLKRREDGVVFVEVIISNTQASSLDVLPNDEIWSAGDMQIGSKYLDKDDWKHLVAYIKDCPRPMEIVLRRRLANSESRPKSPKPVSPPPPTAPDILASSSASASARTTSSSSETNNDKKAAAPVASGDSPKDMSDTPSPSPPPPPPATVPAKGASSASAAIQASASATAPSMVTAPVPVSADEEAQAVLRKLSSRLIFKEKSDPSNFAFFGGVGKSSGGAASNPPPLTLLKPGRKLIRNEYLQIGARKTLFGGPTRRHFFLLSDLLLLTEPQADKFVVKDVIDLAACKVNVAVVSDLLEESDVSSKRAFEILHPGGTIVVLCTDFAHRQAWVQAVLAEVFEGVGREGRGLGWRHQYLLGTMHAAVLSRDINKVKALLQACDRGEMEYLELEENDDDGFTPLHYACMLRIRNIVKLLHDYNTDVTVKDGRGLTALHWCAMQLDSESLDVLCMQVFDVNIRDDLDRTPLYLACVEGRGVSGYTDVTELSKCVNILLNAGANPFLKDKAGRCVLHFASASWEYPVVESIVARSNADINISSDDNGRTPLHFACACVQLKMAVGEGFKILNMNGSKDTSTEAADMDHSLRTVTSLIAAGANLNSKDFNGCSPLSLVISSISAWGSTAMPLLILMLSHGARLDEAPSLALQNQSAEMIRGCDEAIAEWNKKSVLDGDYAKVTLKLFESRGAPNLVASGKTICTLCMSGFTIFKRQHHCRLCETLCCDDCSKKRVTCTSDGKAAQVRVCDSCYNVVADRVDVARTTLFLSGKGTSPHAAEADFDSEKKSLLSGSSASQGQDGRGQRGAAASGGTSGTMSALSEAGKNLEERGERLRNLDDKSKKLADASHEFANLAKQLNQQQQRSWW